MKTRKKHPEALFSSSWRRANHMITEGDRQVHFITSNKNRFTSCVPHSTNVKMPFAFLDTTLRWNHALHHVNDHTDKHLSNRTGTTRLNSRTCVFDCVWQATVSFLTLVSNVCEIFMSLSINHCLQWCSMMNVCCFNWSGYIHKVFAGRSIL